MRVNALATCLALGLVAPLFQVPKPKALSQCDGLSQLSGSWLSKFQCGAGRSFGDTAAGREANSYSTVCWAVFSVEKSQDIK